MLFDHIYAQGIHCFESRQSVSDHRSSHLQQGDGRAQTWNGGKRNDLCCGKREQLQSCRCDDPQCAFAPNEKVTKVIAGVVLAQTAQSIPELPAGGGHFNAKAEVSCIPVPQDLHTPCICCQVAADRAAAFGGKTEREQANRLLRQPLEPAGA